MVGGHDLAVMINQTPYAQKVQGDSHSILITSQENLNREAVKRYENEQKEVVQTNEAQKPLHVKEETEKENQRKREKRKNDTKKEEESLNGINERGKIINVIV